MWYQSRQRLTNLNVFTSALTVDSLMSLLMMKSELMKMAMLVMMTMMMMMSMTEVMVLMIREEVVVYYWVCFYGVYGRSSSV